MPPTVEEVSASLVREYLSRKGLKATLATMDSEMPRSEASISNRSVLAHELCIERLMRKNKESVHPYHSMVEVIVSYLIKKLSATTRSSSLEQHSQHSSSTTKGSSLIQQQGVSMDSLATTSSQQQQQTSKQEKSIMERGNGGKPITYTAAAAATQLVAERRETEPAATVGRTRELPGERREQAAAAVGRTRELPGERREQAAAAVGRTRELPGERREQAAAAVGRTRELPGERREQAAAAVGRTRELPGERREQAAAAVGRTRELPGERREQAIPGERREQAIAGTMEPGERREQAAAAAVAVVGSSVVVTTGGGTTKLSSSRVRLGGRATHRPSPGGAQVKKTSRLQQRMAATHRTANLSLPHHEPASLPPPTSEQLTASGPPVTSESTMAPLEGVSKEPQQRHAHNRGGLNELLFEDIEDDELNQLDYSTGGGPAAAGRAAMAAVYPRGKPITMDTAKSLRQLVFGSSVGPSFNAEWRQQNFIFSDRPQLQYGLVQHKGGPCGVLACVQAYILKHLLFSADSRTYPTTSPEPSKDERRAALVNALSEILWRAAAGDTSEQAVLTLCMVPTSNNSRARTAQYTHDGITEQLVLYTFSEWSTLNQFIASNIRAYEGAGSCIMVLYSAILSRGLVKCQSDMDDELTGHLMGAHGYCTQELINLLLTGCAVSNVFNGTMQLDSGGDTKHTLRGVHHQSEVGLLSLFEHYGSCKVGSHYKDPVHPIWVVCSESHFTVLFGLHPSAAALHSSRNTTQSQLQQLVYYDGLANFDEPVILTINDGSTHYSSSTGEEEEQLVPPLNLCILTRWSNVDISWNTEPIL